jgi:acyl transferase domain-containing protein/acyl carrier protein
MNSHNQHVAVIGISGYFPQAPTMKQFVANLKNGVDSVRSLSKDRLEKSGLDLNKNYLIHGYLDRIDLFDHQFFNISQREAEFMHPEQRLLLELTCEAIENSGYCLSDFRGTNTAVLFGGDTNSEYFSLSKDNDPTRLTGNLNAVTAGRVSYFLDLTGSSMMIDTSCSSSLVVVFEACQKIISNQVDYAIAGGFNAHITFHEMSKYSRNIGITSPDGKSKTFDASANGTGGGEGGGVVLLKRLDKALADNDNIHAVIRGGAVNHQGGKSNGLTAPSPKAQSEVISRAWKNASVNPESIAFIEAHGTGTKLGDPIEFQAISDAFKEYTDKRKFCAVSAVKTNIGHLGKAAGIAGLIKSVLSLKHKVIFPSLHFTKPNPFIDFENTAAFVNAELKEWKKQNEPRRCGVSSFGINGTNAHLILEEVIQESISESVPSDNNLFLKVSAKTKSSLKAYLQKIQHHLSETDESLHDILYTLNRNRDDYDFRVGIKANDKEELQRNVINIIENFDNKSFQAVQRKKEIVLLLSDDGLSGDWANSLSCQYTTFSKEFQEARGIFELNDPGKILEKVVAQYSLYKLLLSLGFNLKTVIGTGYSKITQRLIAGTVALKDITKEIAKQEYCLPLNEEKLRSVIEEFSRKEDSLFLELGAEGKLLKKLNEWAVPQSCIAALFEVDTNNMPVLNLAELYNRGVAIGWEAYYDERKEVFRRVEAPTYPFDGIRCWVQPSFERPSGSIEDWLYELKWVKDEASPVGNAVSEAVIVLFSDKYNIAQTLKEKLSYYNNQCIVVTFSESYQKKSENWYEIRVDQEEDYVHLENELRNTFLQIHALVHLGNYTCPASLNSDNFHGCLENGLNSQLFVIMSFKAHLKNRNAQLLFVSAHAYNVTGTETLLSPTHGTSPALLKGLLVEYPTLKVSHVDFSFSEEPNDITAISNSLLNELANYEQMRFIAFRNGTRYVQLLEQIQVKKDNSPEIINGTYIVTGGARGIGYEISKSIASKHSCKIIIIGRTRLPEMNSWGGYIAANPYDDKTPLLQNLLELQSNGASVEYYALDLADKDTVKHFFVELAKRYTKIDGVIHGAGLKSNSISIESKTIKEIRHVLSPKVEGTIYLEEFSRPLKPDFFICFSSLNAIVAQKYTADYAAANAFQDSFAQYMSAKHKKFISINWPGWKNTGMSASPHGAGDDQKNTLNITRESGVSLFALALRLGKANVAVVNIDLTDFRINPYFLLEENGLVKKAIHGNTNVQSNLFEGWSDTEIKLKNIWSEVLKANDIDRETDFFALGGHSLNGTQVLNRIEKEFKVVLEFEDILTYGTVSELSKRIEGMEVDRSKNRFDDLVPVVEQAHYDISGAQKRIWLFDQLNENKHIYNMPGAFELQGTINPLSIELAFEKIIQRHESIRSNIVSINGEPKQVIRKYEPNEYRIKYIDITNELNKEELAIKISREEAETNFRLESDPFLRLKIIVMEKDRHILLFTMHHIISDAWSYGVMVSEFLTLYNAGVAGIPVVLPFLKIQYKDYVAWLNRQLNDISLNTYREYWMKNLSGIHTDSILETDFPRKAGKSFSGDVVQFVLDPSMAKALKQYSVDNNSTLYMTLVAMVKILIFKFTYQKNITVGTPISGRDHKELEGQIGLFINTLALRTTVYERDNFTDTLNRVKKTILEGFRYQLYPIESIIEDLNIPASNRSHPLFDVMVQVLNPETGLDKITNMQGVSIKLFDAFKIKSLVDLYFTFSEIQDTIQCNLVFNKGLFKKETMELLCDNFVSLQAAMIQNPLIKIEEVNISGNQEKSEMSIHFDAAFNLDL